MLVDFLIYSFIQRITMCPHGYHHSILCTTRKCSETFCCNLFGITGIFFIFDETVTEVLSIFTKITYLWHTRDATAISDKNNEQHMQKLGIAHSCFEMLHRRPIFSWEGNFSPAPGQKSPGSILLYHYKK